MILHRIEIDQSGQIGRLNTDTVFAFSDGISYAIVIPARVKRAAYQHLKQRYREVREPYLALFAAGIFLLIKDLLHQIDRMLIDEEFTGKEAQIRGRLLNHIRISILHQRPDSVLADREEIKSSPQSIRNLPSPKNQTGVKPAPIRLLP